MSQINLNHTTPAAPSGNTNVTWQTDASNNISGYVPNSTSPLTTKGDLYGFDTAGDRIPVGTDGDVLTDDSGAALGVSWQAGGGGFSSQTNETGSRSLATVYHNTTGKYMLVTILGGASSGGTLKLYTDSSNPPTTLVAGATMASSGFVQTVVALVKPGDFYEMTGDGGSNIQSWVEST